MQKLMKALLVSKWKLIGKKDLTKFDSSRYHEKPYQKDVWLFGVGVIKSNKSDSLRRSSKN